MNLRRSRSEAGTTLVEVLVTLVLVSTGLLGLVGLQLATVQNTNSAAQRFEATLLGQDILERMRANRTAAVAGAYDIGLGDVPGDATLAEEDLATWKLTLARLPGGDGAVAVEDGVATITVAWTDVSDDNQVADDNPRAMSVFLRTDL